MSIFEPGRHVTVTLPEVGPVPGRIEASGDEEICVSIFVRTEKPVAWLSGRASIEATTPRGVYEVSGQMSVRGKGLDSLVVVALSGDSRVVQRRNYVRVDAVVEARVARDEEDGEEKRAAAVNVSGGGFLLSGAEWLGMGEAIRFSLELGDGYAPVQGRARVVRFAEKDTRGCEITEIDGAAREALVRFTFDRQRAELRRQRA